MLNKKNENKESTMSDSSGSFVGPLNQKIIKRPINKIHNKKTVSTEVKEVVDSSSSGSYDVPFGSGGKNPLKINGEKSIKNSRAVKDKNFPKWGGPGGIFIKIKDKCRRFPYCNQGDINAIEILREAITEVSKEKKIKREMLENLIIKEIKNIFINDERS